MGLLLSIAFAPLVASHFWEKNSRKALVSFLFSLPVAIYFFSEGHSIELAHSGLEYFSFIVLLGSLYVVSGGILLKGDIKGTPGNNALFLFIGGILANFIGTTGASMVLIRPMLRINSQRKCTKHIPVFFIFIVSNIAGCLTPLGDPPLFLGFLRGVPFAWTLSLFPQWLVCFILLLLVFIVMDAIQYSKESPESLKMDETQIEPITLSGKNNFLLLIGVMAAVIFEPGLKQTFSFLEKVPVKELLMLLMGGLSYALTPLELRKENGFSFGPIAEVAILFAGIFITMIPALKILEARGGEFGIVRPWQFFWLAGSLSSFLDNAPTYLTFLSLAKGLVASGAVPAEFAGMTQVVGIPEIYLKAISCGAVFMGANTYIGNGPNFMVKSIADEAGWSTPSFFGYMVYSGLILIPIFLLVGAVFFN